MKISFGMMPTMSRRSFGVRQTKTAKNTYQSAFILQDLYAVNNAKITVRDGIEIDNKRG